MSFNNFFFDSIYVAEIQNGMEWKLFHSAKTSIFCSCIRKISFLSKWYHFKFPCRLWQKRVYQESLRQTKDSWGLYFGYRSFEIFLLLCPSVLYSVEQPFAIALQPLFLLHRFPIIICWPVLALKKPKKQQTKTLVCSSFYFYLCIFVYVSGHTWIKFDLIIFI